jgi:hypothetical protein
MTKNFVAANKLAVMPKNKLDQSLSQPTITSLMM